MTRTYLKIHMLVLNMTLPGRTRALAGNPSAAKP